MMHHTIDDDHGGDNGGDVGGDNHGGDNGGGVVDLNIFLRKKI